MARRKARHSSLPSTALTRETVSITTWLVFFLLASTILTPFGPQVAHASINGNIINNGSFEQGLTGWRLDTNFACEGVANATSTVDSSRWVEGGQSAKVFTGPITPTGCIPGDFTGRTVGFTQFPQFLQPGLTFNNLTDSLGAFSFWFYLEPYGSGIAGFEVRIFGSESTAELDYVFDPDPYLNYPNYTDPATHRDGLRAIIFYGYQPGQWYHFSRNLKADWTYPTPGLGGLNASRNLSLIQFEGLAIDKGGIVESETFWLDDVRVYVGIDLPQPVASFTINVTASTDLTAASLDASSSSDPGGTIAGYTWSFGDGQTGTGIIVHHTYSIGGTYTITLNVTDNGGASHTSSKTIQLLPNILPSIDFIDRQGYSLGDKVTFIILNQTGTQVQYQYGRIVPYGVYLLEAYYQGYQVYKAPLSLTSQSPTQLQFSPLDTTRSQYIAVNSTTSGIVVSQSDNSQIAFTLEGTGPYLIVVNVPSRPVFVERNGARIADWVYNSTSQTVAIETDVPGSFQVVLDEPSTFPYLYLGGAVAGILGAAILSIVLWRRRIRLRSLRAGSAN